MTAHRTDDGPSGVVAWVGTHRGGPLAVAVSGPALLIIATVVGPDCGFCEPLLQMAYLWLAAFVVVPVVLLLTLVDRARQVQWTLALPSLVVAVLLAISSLTPM